MPPLNPGNSAVVPVMMMNPSDGQPMASPMAVETAPGGSESTTISTNGTTTVTTGPGVYHGCSALALGTTWGVSVFDVNGTATKTLSAFGILASLGVLALPAPAGVGVRFAGELRVVTSGVLPGAINVIWD